MNTMQNHYRDIFLLSFRKIISLYYESHMKISFRRKYFSLARNAGRVSVKCYCTVCTEMIQCLYLTKLKVKLKISVPLLVSHPFHGPLLVVEFHQHMFTLEWFCGQQKTLGSCRDVNLKIYLPHVQNSLIYTR
jgi:hypothetical protein